MDQQDSWDISPQQGDGSVPNVSKRTWSEIRVGIMLIAWFIMFNTFESLSRSVIGLLDTNYTLDGWGRLFISAGAAAFLSFFILSAAKPAQD